MIVVSDASPFVGLIKIGCVDILPAMFRTIVLPVEVLAELRLPTQAEAVRKFSKVPPDWLVVRSAKSIEPIAGLDAGEHAAIWLAQELDADLLLIDERRGRAEAIARSLSTARTAAVMLDAAGRGMLDDLRGAFERLKRTNFRVPHAVLDQLLAIHENMQSGER